MVLYLGFFALILLFLLKAVIHCEDPETRHIALCLFSALLAFFVFAGTANAMYDQVVWSLFGLSVSLGRTAGAGGLAGVATSRRRRSISAEA